MRHNPLCTIGVALPVLLAGCLMTGCGTAFCRVPYKVGVKKPFVEHHNPDGSKSADLRDPRYWSCSVKGLELYRIGPDYYVKCNFVYAPFHAEKFTYYCTWEGMHLPYKGEVVPDKNSATWEKATYYFRVSGEQQKKASLAAYCKPLPQTGTRGPEVLPEQEAQQLHPVLVKRFDVAKPITPLPTHKLPERYSWTHYVMLPVAGLTAVLVDLPCSVVCSLGVGAASIITLPLIH